MITTVNAADVGEAARAVLALPSPREDDGDYTRVRGHDLEEIWEQDRSPHVAAAYASRLNLLVRLITDRVPPGSKILDVGCAQGTLGLLLASRGYLVTLLDVRAGHIAYARERYKGPNVEFRVGRLEDSAFDEAFDLVVLSEVIEHIRAPSGLLAAIHRELAPEGLLLITTPNAGFALARQPSYGRANQGVIDDLEDASADGDDHRFLFTREELIAVIRAARFRLEEHGFFVPFWLSGHLKTRHLYRLIGRQNAMKFGVPDLLGPGLVHRRLCSSQFLLGRRS